MERILIKIVHVITGLGDGGAEGMLYRLCSENRENEHVVVSLMNYGKFGPLLEQKGIHVKVLGMRRGHFTLDGLITLWNFFRRMNPDVVQTWLYHADLIGGILARLAKVNRIYWNIRNGKLEHGKSNISTFIVMLLCSLASYFVPNKIVCCSVHAAKWHIDKGYSRRKIKIIPNGYDLSSFYRSDALGDKLRKKWNITKKIPLLGMVARYDPQKDHENLIRALGGLKRAGQPFLCVLIGSGMNHNNKAIKEFLAKEGLSGDVRLLGRRSDIASVMNAIDIHILSSSGEAFPNVLAEAMACGTLCVTTDVGDASFIVGKCGWVVQPMNHRALSVAILSAIRCIYNKKIKYQRSKKCINRISCLFDIKKVSKMYSDLWLGCD